MPKRKTTARKKTLAEADSNGDTTDSAVAVANVDPVPLPTKKSRVTEHRTNTNSKFVIF